MASVVETLDTEVPAKARRRRFPANLGRQIHVLPPDLKEERRAVDNFRFL